MKDVNRIASSVLHPGSASRADVRSLMRMQAQALLTQIQTALGRRNSGSPAAPGARRVAR